MKDIRVSVFPTVARHEDASCFHCGADLNPAFPSPSGFPAGRGAYRQGCEKCGFATFYDLEREDTRLMRPPD